MFIVAFHYLLEIALNCTGLTENYLRNKRLKDFKWDIGSLTEDFNMNIKQCSYIKKYE